MIRTKSFSCTKEDPATPSRSCLNLNPCSSVRLDLRWSHFMFDPHQDHHHHQDFTSDSESDRDFKQDHVTNDQTPEQEYDDDPRDSQESYAFLGELSRQITDVLSHACKLNDAYVSFPNRKDPIAIFYSRSQPDFELQEYVLDVMNNVDCSPAVFVLALVYIIRVSKSNKRLRICSWNVHRLFVAALVVAAKYLEFAVLSNKDLGLNCGLTNVREVNMLERMMLKELKWDLNCQKAEFWFTLESIMG